MALPQPSETALTSLAILKVNFDQGQDYIANFLPFVLEGIRLSPNKEVSLPELQATIGETFGLHLPQGPLKTIVKRAAKKEFLKIHNHLFIRNDEALANLQLGRTRQDVLRRHEALISKLIDFARKQYELEWTKEQSEAALLAYLEDHSIPILAAAVQGQAIVQGAQRQDHSEVVIGAFIVNLHEADPEGFIFLETVVKGRILANVLLFPDIGGVLRRFERLDVYLDTPLVLRALGLAPKPLNDACIELIELLYKHGATLCVFDHTIDEILRVLDAGVRILKNGSRQPHGQTIEYLVTAGYQASDVELLIAKLPQHLRRLRINQRSKPEHQATVGVDESKMQELIEAEIPYLNREALHHDVDSLAAIHRLRRGRIQRHIESCTAVFSTTNSALARASARFFQQEYDGTTVPLCIVDHVLATIAWLKQPALATDLPTKQILANAYAALNPPDNLWRRYLSEIERLKEKGDISLQDYNLLRYSMDSRSALMNFTLGEPEALTEGTVIEILEQSKAAARRVVESQLLTQTELRAVAESRASLAETRAQREQEAQRARFEEIATSVSRTFMRLVLWMGIIGLTGGTILSSQQSPFPTPWNHVSTGIVAFTTIFGIWSMIFGTSLKAATQQAEISVAKWSHARIASFLAPRSY